MRGWPRCGGERRRSGGGPRRRCPPRPRGRGGAWALQRALGNRETARLLRAAPRVQRRLSVDGPKTAELLALLGRHAGLALARAEDGQVTVAATTGGGSPPLRTALRTLIDDDHRHARARAAADSQAELGGYGATQELNVPNLVDVDDYVGGFGATTAIHELWENANAVAEPGLTPFEVGHAAALEVERRIGAQLVGGQGRLAMAESADGNEFAFDYGELFVHTVVHDFSKRLTEAKKRERAVLLRKPVGGFGQGSALVDSAAVDDYDAAIAAAAAAMERRPLSTVGVIGLRTAAEAPGLARDRAEGVLSDLLTDDDRGYAEPQAAAAAQAGAAIVVYEPGAPLGQGDVLGLLGDD